MTVEALRRAAAHVLVDDVGAPSLTDDQQHHVFRVLRVRDGQAVTVTDGAGAWRRCVAADRALEPVGDVESVPRRRSPVTVAFAIPKQDRPEWIVQKLTEIGVDRIVLLHADRSVVRWDGERADRHLVKLRRVCGEALQQSRGAWLPELHGPVPAASILPDVVAAEPEAPPLDRAVRAVAIGPEGGWTAGELAAAAATASIGASVLRVETAAVVAASRLVMHAE